MKWLPTWLLLALTCAVAAASEDLSRDASGWLMEINEAARQLNYSGTFVYLQGDRIESMKVAHRAGEEDMRQRIYSLNGAPREVIRSASQVWCYAPDKKFGVHEFRQVTKQGFPNVLPRNLEALREHYEIHRGRVGRVADRMAQQIVIAPRDELRYGYELWADERTGLLLKAALLDGAGRPIEQYLFTEVEIGRPISDSELQPVTAESDLVWYGDASRKRATESKDEPVLREWAVEDIPPGFTLTRKIERLSAMEANATQHYVFSDGLATVSLFIEEINDQSGPRISGINKMGAVHAFGRVMDGYQITVVGEVPSHTVDTIGTSVYSKKQ